MVLLSICAAGRLVSSLLTPAGQADLQESSFLVFFVGFFSGLSLWQAVPLEAEEGSGAGRTPCSPSHPGGQPHGKRWMGPPGSCSPSCGRAGGEVHSTLVRGTAMVARAKSGQAACTAVSLA